MELGEQLGLAFIVIGILMLLAELSSPGAFILVPATVLIVLGAVGLAAPGILLSWWSPVVALVIVVPTTYVAIKMYQKLAPPGPPETTVATTLVGQTGVVLTEVVPSTLKGKVRIDHDTWSATSDKAIPAGRKVVVKASEGVHVTVEEIP
ncbi:MAG: NfeD family protein [Thermoplasmatota archaeon]|nr:NfeD family protein [Candidatus Thermoplasmatota archaeon]MBU1914731.1 NfeD family protein [Candidatus Thermoplasmatota archaeon]